MLKFFKQPYPLDNSLKGKCKDVFGIGTIIFLILFLFRPFGLGEANIENKTLVIAGYGLVTMLTMGINFFLASVLFHKMFQEERWKVYKEILWILWNIFTIGIGNLIYTHLLGYIHLSVNGFVFFQFVTLLAGTIPITLFTLIRQNYLLKKYLRATCELNEKLQEQRNNQEKSYQGEVELISDNKNEKLTISLNDLYYITSADNYVEVSYMQEDKIEKTMLRNSLTRIKELLKNYTFLFHCHRSFIVNTDKVINVIGNSQGYKLQLENIEKKIPVSRPHSKEIFHLLSR